MASRDIYQRTFDEDVQQDEHNSCPECDGRVTVNARETVCDECGLVLDDDWIDRGPEWRAYTEDNGGRRAGTPNTVARHDRGIGSRIGRQRDGYGQQLDGDTQERLSRLRRRNSRAKIGSKAERNQVAGFTEIRRLVGAFGFTERVRDQACQLFRTAQSAGFLIGRSIEAVTSACLYAVCRLNEHPRTFQDVASLSKISEDRVRTAYTALNRELALPVPPACPRQYVSQLVSAVDASRETERVATELLEAADKQVAANGHHPSGTAAGAIYLAGQLTGEVLTQDALAAAAGVTSATVRKRY